MDDFDIEAPSFSLGIDLDDDNRHADLVVDDSDPEPAADESFKRNVRRRRRLRKAAAVSVSSSATLSSHNVNLQSSPPAADFNDQEEEIEDFSPEEGDATVSQNKAMGSASKISLPAQGSVVFNSVKKSEDRNEMPCYQTNHKGETDGVKFEIPRLTVSPVRKFLLVESDSDDLTDFVKKDTVPKRINTSGGLTDNSSKKSVKDSSGGSHQNDDLWNDFLSPKRFTFSTPVLDEVCDEYFHALKENNDPQRPARKGNNENVTEKLTDMLIQQNPGIRNSIPPAHHYFFHNDMRIQNLVRSRLHNFYPLVDVLDNRRDDLLGTPYIDYRSQFTQGGASTSRKQPNQKRNVAGNSAKDRRKCKRVVENVSQASESWVNPKASASSRTPRDAGQRRVRADGSSDGHCPKNTTSAGHWFTGSDGKRVYVSACGQELTGRLAYMHYKKENGGFKKSRKKAAAKKK